MNIFIELVVPVSTTSVYHNAMITDLKYVYV